MGGVPICEFQISFGGEIVMDDCHGVVVCTLKLESGCVHRMYESMFYGFIFCNFVHFDAFGNGCALFMN